MASKNNKKSAPSSTPQRKSQQKIPVNLNPSQNNGITVVGIGASAGGLLSLQHRLDLMGCSLQIKSQPNTTDTQVIIDIPAEK